MIVLSVPMRLRLATWALFLCVPLIAIQVIIVTRAPWWQLPYRNMGYWAFALTLIYIPLSSWMIAARKWAYYLTAALLTVWLVVSILYSIRLAYPPLGFYTLFLSAFFCGELFWIKYEMERSFFDSGMAWYQGFPKAIPSLSCHLLVGDKELKMKVAKFDSEGAFIFTPERPSSDAWAQILSEKQVVTSFDFKSNVVTCDVRLVFHSPRSNGLGVQFRNLSDDLKKEVGDIVEALRGEGYLS